MLIVFFFLEKSYFSPFKTLYPFFFNGNIKEDY